MEPSEVFPFPLDNQELNHILTFKEFIIPALIVGLLFLVIYLLISQKKEILKRLPALVGDQSTEAQMAVSPQPEPDDDASAPGREDDVLQQEESTFDTVENLRQELSKVLADNEALINENAQLNKCLDEYEKMIPCPDGMNTISDSEQFVRFFTEKQLSPSKETIRLIAEKGNQWIHEFNTMNIKDNDSKVSFYLVLKTLIDMAKTLKEQDVFMSHVFKRYSSFIQSPGKLNVRDNKEDEILFLKYSLELSVLFRDFIRRIYNPEHFQQGNPQNMNFEMITKDLKPSQMASGYSFRQYDGSNIPSNLLAYSILCNKYQITDFEVFISGDTIQKNIQ